MNDTSLSLLHRLRHAPESESWNRLVDLYAPLIRAWLRKYDVQDSDADDRVQELLLAVPEAVPSMRLAWKSKGESHFDGGLALLCLDDVCTVFRLS